MDNSLRLCSRGQSSLSMDGIYDGPDHIQYGLCSSLDAPSSDRANPFFVGLTGGNVMDQGGVDLYKLE